MNWGLVQDFVILGVHVDLPSNWRWVSNSFSYGFEIRSGLLWRESTSRRERREGGRGGERKQMITDYEKRGSR